MVAGAVKIPTQDGEIPAYRAMPSAGKNFPTILVVSEIFGVHEHIQDVCRRLAHLGYLAIANQLKPTNPINIASTLRVPILGLYGGKDTSIPLTTIEQMRDRLKSSQSKSEIIVYPDAPHAFFADYRPSYHEKEAQDGWKHLSSLVQTTWDLI